MCTYFSVSQCLTYPFIAFRTFPDWENIPLLGLLLVFLITFLIPFYSGFSHKEPPPLPLVGDTVGCPQVPFQGGFIGPAAGTAVGRQVLLAGPSRDCSAVESCLVQGQILPWAAPI